MSAELEERREEATMAARSGSVGVGLTTVDTRTILGSLSEPGGRAEQVARKLERAISLGLLRDGERLPAEAQLAQQVGVATVTLREALAVLRQQGLVETHRGRGGGTFVKAPDAHADTGLLARLHQLGAQQIREIGDHRMAISGTAAALAATRAVPAEVERLRRQVERLRQAVMPSERGRADAQFTIEVAAASQSSRLTGEEMRLRAELGDLLWWQLTDRDHADKVRLRTRLVSALQRGSASAARRVAEQHVHADTQRLLTLRLQLYDVAAIDVSERREAAL
jgi:DNA-binding FadR family transcriptional regulator